MDYELVDNIMSVIVCLLAVKLPINVLLKRKTSVVDVAMIVALFVLWWSVWHFTKQNKKNKKSIDKLKTVC